jgi:Domain of unknown function (DUF4136)
MRAACVLATVLAFALPATGIAQKAPGATPKVVIEYNKKTDLAKYKTYSWGAGHSALLPAADKAIIAEVEKQLSANGMTKAAAGPGDLVVRYHSVERADVDLSTFDTKPPAAGEQRSMAQTVKVGTLMVDLVDPGTKKLLWRGRIEGAISHDPATLEQQVANAVARLFEKFPVGVPTR